MDEPFGALDEQSRRRLGVRSPDPARGRQDDRAGHAQPRRGHLLGRPRGRDVEPARPDHRGDHRSTSRIRGAGVHDRPPLRPRPGPAVRAAHRRPAAPARPKVAGMTVRANAGVWALRWAASLAVAGAWPYATGPGGVSPLLLPGHRRCGSEPSPSWSRDRRSGRTSGSRSSRSSWRSRSRWCSASWPALSAAGPRCGRGSASRCSRGATWCRTCMFYPLFLLWAGVGVWSKILFAAVAGFFPIAINTLRGFRASTGATCGSGRRSAPRPAARLAGQAGGGAADGAVRREDRRRARR